MASEIIQLQRQMVEDLIRKRKSPDKDFWERFYILTGQFMECRSRARAEGLPLRAIQI